MSFTVLRRSLVSSSLRSTRLIAPAPLLLRRSVASSVSNRPASQAFDHAATNIKEETGNLAADVAKTIAGSNMTTQLASSLKEDTFVGLTKANLAAVPKPAMIVGLAGGIPYIGASGMTVYLAHQAGLVATGASTMDPGLALTYFDQALTFQVAYGAVMLSFLGAMHWGMEFAGLGGKQGLKRLALGASPILLAIPTLSFEPMTALTVQWLGFTALWYADARATSFGWTPKWYGQYRFYLSILVGTCILGSLFGTSYYGPVAGHGFLTHELNEIRQERRDLIKEQELPANENVKAVRQKAGEPGFVVLSRKQTEEKQ
ncbi:hypothetical protein CYLTODRAFT_451867 [Cylindrobasidium torrendii FP15055 ss-10]|uniref:Uncharacterized protein n=1 Tax=Cylindrobasidium torrendii FP15055 ss-10 TaxID=1314674 RepID=A0A0D7BIB9_9AGAR|nr:hypothetical protein CYLTODRAFT_451867 [Cylindrobasidium torrendii FP15055 ss-10]